VVFVQRIFNTFTKSETGKMYRRERTSLRGGEKEKEKEKNIFFSSFLLLRGGRLPLYN
jgi:hypothetical protein